MSNSYELLESRLTYFTDKAPGGEAWNLSAIVVARVKDDFKTLLEHYFKLTLWSRDTKNILTSWAIDQATFSESQIILLPALKQFILQNEWKIMHKASLYTGNAGIIQVCQ